MRYKSIIFEKCDIQRNDGPMGDIGSVDDEIELKEAKHKFILKLELKVRLTMMAVSHQ